MQSARYISTRGGSPEADFAQALLRGMAPDGGLYMPREWPALPDGGTDYAEIARGVMTPFIGDALPAGALDRAVDRLVAGFDHPDVTPLVELEPGLHLLELFHGPTAAFKDLAMQLAASLADEALKASGDTLTLVVATSGDTGAAAVRAFERAERIRLVVLHPLDRVSPVQRRQMTTCQADNVLNLAVRGDFDDCQRLVKLLLADEGLRARGRLSSVNSINWARLAGQIPYYVSAARRLDAPATFVVPTGNLGDAFAGIAAREMGLPMAGLIAGVNANDALARAVNDGVYARRPAVETTSVSMDVQAPSNFERLVFEAFARDGEVRLPDVLRRAVQSRIAAVSVDEAATHDSIARAWTRWGRVVCPHTAVGLEAARRLAPDGPVVVLSTAHASKFPDAVGAVVGFDPEPAPVVAALSDRAERLTVIDADLDQARDQLSALWRPA